MISTGHAHYLDVGKTASSFIEAQLQNLGCQLRSNRHLGLKGPINKDELYYCTLRNPYKYWISHLNYSKKTNGQIYNFVRNKKPLSLYEYVKIINEDRHDLPETNHGNALNQAWKNMPETMGMLTCHYILYLDSNFLKQKRTESEVEEWFDNHWFKPNSNMVPLNTDNLVYDFCDMVEKHIDKFNVHLNQIEKLRLKEETNNTHTNNEKKHKIEIKNYADMYLNLNDEQRDRTVKMITHYERLIVRHFNYKAPV
jgi:hypothetical protein